MRPAAVYWAKLVLLLAAMLLPVLLALAATPAHAASVAFVVTPDGSRIELHDERGPCEGQALRAVHVTAAGHRTSGCWVLGDGNVTVLFLDGDLARIPVGALRKPAPA